MIFAGDPAHQVSPFGARGANSGVQDVDNLGWKLKLMLDGLAPETLMDTYHEERALAADGNIANSTRSKDFITPQDRQGSLWEIAILYPRPIFILFYYNVTPGYPSKIYVGPRILSFAWRERFSAGATARGAFSRNGSDEMFGRLAIYYRFTQTGSAERNVPSRPRNHRSAVRAKYPEEIWMLARLAGVVAIVAVGGALAYWTAI